jgi:hypothetical protein
LGVISGLDVNSPNRLLYSFIDNLNQSDRTLFPTLSPTNSPTQAPTTQPPTFQLFRINLTILSEAREYLGNPFNVTMNSALFVDFFPNSYENMDLDLYLEQKTENSGWVSAASSTSSSCKESINFNVLSNGQYRWRLYVYGSNVSPGLRLNITFRSNIEKSRNFSSPSAPSPTLNPTGYSPSNFPSLPPSNSPSSLPSTSPTTSPSKTTVITLYYVNLTLNSQVRDYLGDEFVLSSAQFLLGGANLISPSLSMDIDLYLEKRIGPFPTNWTKSAASNSASSDEYISGMFPAGSYRWRLTVYNLVLSADLRVNVSFGSNYPICCEIF